MAKGPGKRSGGLYPVRWMQLACPSKRRRAVPLVILMARGERLPGLPGLHGLLGLLGLLGPPRPLGLLEPLGPLGPQRLRGLRSLGTALRLSLASSQSAIRRRMWT